MTFALWLFRPITTILHTHGWEMLTLLFIASWSHVGRKNSIIIQHLSLWSHHFNLAIRTPFILHRPCRCPVKTLNVARDNQPMGTWSLGPWGTGHWPKLMTTQLSPRQAQIPPNSNNLIMQRRSSLRLPAAKSAEGPSSEIVLPTLTHIYHYLQAPYVLSKQESWNLQISQVANLIRRLFSRRIKLICG